MNIEYSPRYLSERKKFLKGRPEKIKAIRKSLALLAQNPGHPSLNLEKLGGSVVWSVRIDKGNRIFFRWADELTVILIDIGPHDKYKEY